MPIHYYLRPFDHEITISSEPSPRGVWYVVWSQNGGAIWYAVWPRNAEPNPSEHRPTLKPGQVGACLLAYDQALPNATPLGGGGSKDIPPPPWLQQMQFTDFSSFEGAVEIYTGGPRSMVGGPKALAG